VRRNKLIILVLAAVIALPSLVSAQAVRNTKEAVQDEVQIARDKTQLVRDQQEIKDFEAMLKDMNPTMDSATYAELNDRLRHAMKREHEQAQAKIAQANREVAQSRRELRAEQREAAMTASVQDKLQRGDDRRDLRDDRFDRAAAQSRAKRMHSVSAKCEALEPAIKRGHEAAMVKNHRLMGEFLEIMRADLRATATELGEDRRERREDRRERRSDRRK
jgi:cell division septation protein DedD